MSSISSITSQQTLLYPFPLLRCGKLIKRYKRFLADIELNTGEIITIHCPNTGAMTGCADFNDTVWFSTSQNAKRKYAHTWELTEKPNGHLICVNTLIANKVIHHALSHQQLSPFRSYIELYQEVNYGHEKSRIDFLLRAPNYQDCYIEVKSVTFLNPSSPKGQGFFPDAVTTRGQKHLRELMALKQQGLRAVLIFLILHDGIHHVDVAQHIDPIYSDLLKKASKIGVDIFCCKSHISLNGVFTTNCIETFF